ncbi:hypothetical protein SHT65_04035 [Enterococcus faecalis]|uniref:hypothetical protein n=1 Tax=Enterococcus TaxID=1350 RepID=UPI001C707874|nr:hypothetical protein [Enterococcus faecalis]EIT2461584.1 hypothetical protein [Enterococcus faecalis]ELU8995294.1 hypothetical protein [Enterococcus faecalis]ELY8286173.1 hypothetical protein [Enterococcus faecalis]MDT2146787.1 hypothetical protein [Enterococcus faecalis]MDV7872233.1 hypothetical protein [Enterococcus faecalis]
MGNENLQKIYADSTKKRTAQQTKWERAVEGLTFDRLEKKKIEYSLKRKKVRELGNETIYWKKVATANSSHFAIIRMRKSWTKSTRYFE